MVKSSPCLHHAPRVYALANFEDENKLSLQTPPLLFVRRDITQCTNQRGRACFRTAWTVFIILSNPSDPPSASTLIKPPGFHTTSSPQVLHLSARGTCSSAKQLPDTNVNQTAFAQRLLDIFLKKLKLYAAYHTKVTLGSLQSYN